MRRHCAINKVPDEDGKLWFFDERGYPDDYPFTKEDKQRYAEHKKQLDSNHTEG
jgi:hypothetical protein